MPAGQPGEAAAGGAVTGRAGAAGGAAAVDAGGGLWGASGRKFKTHEAARDDNKDIKDTRRSPLDLPLRSPLEALGISISISQAQPGHSSVSLVPDFSLVTRLT